MAEIKDCVGKNVKISKCSITIKSDDGKTCGIVRGISKFTDIQTNKQVDYFHKLSKAGAWGNKVFNLDTCLVADGELYAFRNMRSKLFHAKVGYFSDSEKEKEAEQDKVYNALRETGVNVIECIIV